MNPYPPHTRPKVPPPEPYGPTPSPRQLHWHRQEFYGFLHFTVNTFINKEWGYGDESPEVFNPTAFDADPIVKAAADGGMTGLILTCKHHDGFCLWPSRYTEHSVHFLMSGSTAQTTATDTTGAPVSSGRSTGGPTTTG